MDFVLTMEDPLNAELIALSCLRRLRSVFIRIFNCGNSRTITPKNREDFRDSLDAIVDQGLLEVRMIHLKNKSA